MARDMRFPAIKVQRHSRKGVFSGMFGIGIAPRSVQDDDIKNFEGLSVEPHADRDPFFQQQTGESGAGELASLVGVEISGFRSASASSTASMQKC